MTVFINGEKREIGEGVSLLLFIKQEEVETKIMAAAINMQIVKKDDWEKRLLEEGDKLELLQFVGGG
ncbi:MAG TPA: sulfur carrier protein ThiS [Campylobacterales bacterium]|nr:sulfur carrier protein ThiS [Campylobacterales bacterium]